MLKYKNEHSNFFERKESFLYPWVGWVGDKKYWCSGALDDMAYVLNRVTPVTNRSLFSAFSFLRIVSMFCSHIQLTVSPKKSSFSAARHSRKTQSHSHKNTRGWHQRSLLAFRGLGWLARTENASLPLLPFSKPTKLEYGTVCSSLTHPKP